MAYEKEQNRVTLEEGLRHLPQHYPDASSWNSIEMALSQDELIQKSLPDLPSYDAPPLIWEGIESNLRPAKLVSIHWRYAAAACLIFALASFAVLKIWNTSPDNVSYAFSETVGKMSNKSLGAQDEDEIAFAQVLQLFEDNEMLRQSTAYQDALSEWEELQQAKQELQTISAEYNLQDAQLMRQLRSIENQRTAVLNSLVAFAAN